MSSSSLNHSGQDFSRGEIQAYVRARIPGAKLERDEWRAPCPLHHGKRASFALNADTGLWICHSECHESGNLVQLEMRLGGLGYAEALEEIMSLVNGTSSGSNSPPFRMIETTYPYVDENGRLLYESVRWNPKAFSLRRPDGAGGYVPNIEGVRRVLFRLPRVMESPIVFVCYSEDTELLTRRGWIPFPELMDVDLVAQFSIGGEVEFVRPAARQVFDYSGDMCHFSATWCDMLVTPDHRVLSRVKKYARKGAAEWSRPVVKPADETGRMRYFPAAGILAKDQEAEAITCDQARLLVAWCADGVNEQRGCRVSWNLKKGRKKNRLMDLLDCNGIAYTIHEYPSSPGWTNYRVPREELVACMGRSDKQIPFEAALWPYDVRASILDELKYWDGDGTGLQGTRFFTANKCEADAIAAIAAVTGWGCIVRRDDRTYRPDQKPQYVVNLVSRSWRQVSSTSRTADYCGRVYCCTVPSGFIVTRRNGKTTVSGNCEGEKDVLTMEGMGFVATTNAMGAGNWRSEYSQALRGKDVVIIPDRDPKGWEHAAKVEISLSSVASRVRVIELPQGKDVTEWVEAGGTQEQLLELLDKPAAGARPGPAKEKSKPRQKLTWHLVPPIWQKESHMSWLIEGIVPEASVTILTGESGHGKSILTLAMVGCIAHGMPFLGHKVPQRRVIYLDRENPLHVIKDRIFKLHLEPTDQLVYWDNTCDEPADGPTSPSLLEVARDEHAVFVFDSLVAFYRGSENDSSEARTCMQAYRMLASAGGTVIILHHTGKSDTSKDYRGSSDIKASVDLGFVVEKIGGDDAGLIRDLVLRPFKNRVGESKPLRLYFDSHEFSTNTDGPRIDKQDVLDSIVRTNPGAVGRRIIELGMRAGLPKHWIESALAESAMKGRYYARKGPKNALQYYLSEEAEDDN